jgi:hypothetical protein
VTCKLGALCSETRPNAKPENVMRQLKKGDREMTNIKPKKEEKQVELVKFRNVVLATINY